MLALSIVAGLMLLGIAFGVFEFDGLLDNLRSEGDSSDDEEVHTIEGSSGDDLLLTGDEDDEVDAGDGDDTIDAEGGRDQILAGEGNDQVNGGEGDDTILGEDGDDTIFADQGYDVVLGGLGSDEVDGGAGDDTIFGQEGDDSILARSGSDFVDGGEGNDTIKGGAGNDVLFGIVDSQFDDEIDDDDFLDPDVIVGGAGNDAIFAGSGDTISGGDGNDALLLGSWIDPANPVLVEEFERSEDALIVILSENYAGARVITLDVDPLSPNLATLYLDGVKLADIEAESSMSTYASSLVVVGTDAELEDRLANLQSD